MREEALKVTPGRGEKASPAAQQRETSSADININPRARQEGLSWGSGGGEVGLDRING